MKCSFCSPFNWASVRFIIFYSCAILALVQCILLHRTDVHLPLIQCTWENFSFTCLHCTPFVICSPLVCSAAKDCICLQCIALMDCWEASASPTASCGRPLPDESTRDKPSMMMMMMMMIIVIIIIMLIKDQCKHFLLTKIVVFFVLFLADE